MIIPGLRTPPADTEKAVTDDYVKAVNLNYHIKAAAQVAQQSLYEMCKGFKEMRDSKLYKEIGYRTFEEYCENEVGISRFMAYKYVSVAEIKNVESIQQIGVTKLSILAKLDELQQAEIINKTDLENTSVRELEQQIRQIRAEKDKAVADKSAAEAEASAAAQQAKSLEKAKNALSQQIAALEAEIKELENRPVEVAVEPAKDGVMDKTAFDNICKTYEQQLDKVQEDALQDTIRLNREHTEQMNSLKAESEKKLEELRSQLEAAKREQSELTVSVPDSKETFKAYLATAIDAAKRLCEFIGNNSADSNHDLFVSKAKQFFEKMTEDIA
jgi:DNA repair exonuclease SbcCD ATPase subunit|nr:MAG TPA: Protein of unknown function (DUF3102) [Caudoviricetes sp.]